MNDAMAFAQRVETILQNMTEKERMLMFQHPNVAAASGLLEGADVQDTLAVGVITLIYQAGVDSVYNKIMVPATKETAPMH